MSAAIEVPAAPWALDVFVPGKPEPKGSTRAFVRGGRAVTIADNKVTQRAWSAYVHDAVAESWTVLADLRPLRPDWTSGPITGPVRMDVDFVMPRRKSAPKTRTDPLTRKPDIDKLARCVMDALTHVVWVDDAQVVDLRTSKREAEIGETPGARIRVALL